MKIAIQLIISILLIVPICQAADNAYDVMIMEATLGDSKPATVSIDKHDKPGEIAFGQMQGDRFVGQKIQFIALGIGHKDVEVIVEDIGGPSKDKMSGLEIQSATKKIFRMEADGVSRTIEISGKKLTFRIHAIGGVGGSSKILIEQAAPSNR